MVEKIAYLTIDDAPSEDFRQKIDYLISKNIPAVFFCRGELLEERPKEVIYAIKKGFIIGSHSYRHYKFSDLGLEKAKEQIKKTDDIIEKIYRESGVKRPAKFFRFPYGDKGGLKYDEVFEPYKGEGKKRKEEIQEFLRKLGYTQPKFENITYKYYRKAGLLDDADWYWTYDVMEWATFKDKPPLGLDSLEKIFERMDEDVPEGCRGLNYPGSEEIILMHDHKKTSEMFKPIIERLLDKGIKFKLPRLN